MAPAHDLHLRRVAVYVSGSIAAYKACEVVTLLRKRGAQVRVAMTPAATRFVSPMTFQSLSGAPVATSLWADDSSGHGMDHIGLSAWAEIQVAVAASADLIARLAMGLADDAVTTTALACGAPLIVAPAMESQMWSNSATQGHAATLMRRGATMVGPVSGRLASGLDGLGRMAEPEQIVAAIAEALRADPQLRWLEGTTVVISAGGTREPIDPVRFLGNRSSGKMGTALFHEALRLGARVTLVTAAPPPPHEFGLRVVPVVTAAEMLEALSSTLPGATVLVMAAAVADYRPATVSPRKLKKGAGALRLELTPTTDILTSLREAGALQGITVVGFAAETDDLIASAQQKLAAKGLDLVVANDVGREGVGMEADDNAVVILDGDGVVAEVERAPKAKIAQAIFAALESVIRPMSPAGAHELPAATEGPPPPT